MPAAKMSKCRNCGASMTIKPSTDPDYKFMLVHPNAEPCYYQYKLETHQNTVVECVEEWNKFNTRTL